MPWTAEDVDKHIKDLSSNEKETWVEVANKALAACEKAGRKDCDASAIKQANAVIGKLKEVNATPCSWLTESTSYTKLNEDVGNAVRQLAPVDGWAYIEELFDDFAIYQIGGPNQAGAYFKASYTIGADDIVTLGAATKVEKVTTYPMVESFVEAATFKALIQGLMRQARGVANHKSVPKAVKSKLADLGTLLQKTYKTIAGEGEGSTSESAGGPLTQEEFNEDSGVLLDMSQPPLPNPDPEAVYDLFKPNKVGGGG